MDCCELILVIRGTVHLQEGQRQFLLRPGDYILLHAGIPHGGWQASREKIEFYWVHFYADRVPEAPITGTLADPGILVQSARQLLQIHQSGFYPVGTGDAMLQVLLAELSVQQEKLQKLPVLAAAVCEYIRDHADTALTAAKVAKAMGYSADHLSRVLKQSCGRTLRQQITLQRMNRARLMLQTTDMTVAELAFRLGWSDPNLFEKFFTYHQKNTPTAYRNSFARNHINHK